MPAIRAAYTLHPDTGSLGCWVLPSWRTDLRGLAATAFPVQPVSGSPAERRAAWGKAISDALTALCEIRVPLSSVSPNLMLNQEPFCRVDGLDYVAQPIVFIVTILSLSPVEYKLEIREGSSRMVRV